MKQKNLSNSLCSFFVSLITLTLLVLSSRAQDNKASTSHDQPSTDSFDIRKSSFLLPQALPKGHYYHSLSLFYVIVPKDWAHDIIQAPMFSYAGKYTLPKGFNLQGSISTLVVSTRANLGPFWNYDLDRYHFGIGYQVAFNLGVLYEFGFHTVLTGWEQQPSITLGYSFDKSSVILRGDVYWTTALYLSDGKNTVPFTTSFINGYSLTASLEQRLWKNHVMSFGVKVNYLKYHILSWPAFPVNSYRYFVPEFQLGLNF